MNLLQTFEQEQLTKLTENKETPSFQAGDTLKVLVKVIEGTRERIQAFEGVCIARKNAGINSSFTVRKISYGEGVERVFPLYSPNIEIQLVRKGIVRRAKLYYLRGLTGKKARIAEKIIRKTEISVPLAAKNPKLEEETPPSAPQEDKKDVKATANAKAPEPQKEEKQKAKKEEKKEEEDKKE